MVFFLLVLFQFIYFFTRIFFFFFLSILHVFFYLEIFIPNWNKLMNEKKNDKFIYNYAKNNEN